MRSKGFYYYFQFVIITLLVSRTVLLLESPSLFISGGWISHYYSRSLSRWFIEYVFTNLGHGCLMCYVNLSVFQLYWSYASWPYWLTLNSQFIKKQALSWGHEMYQPAHQWDPPVPCNAGKVSSNKFFLSSGTWIDLLIIALDWYLYC